MTAYEIFLVGVGVAGSGFGAFFIAVRLDTVPADLRWRWLLAGGLTATLVLVWGVLLWDRQEFAALALILIAGTLLLITVFRSVKR